MMHPLLLLVGSKTLSVSLERAPELFNLCSVYSVIYHQLSSPEDSGRVYIRVSPLSALRLQRLCARHGIELSSHKSSGLPYLLLETLKRPGMVLGLLLAAFTLISARAVVWDVRVEGNQRVPDSEIISLLKDSGIGIGTPIRDIDIDGTELRFLIASDQISWMAVNLRGTVINVEVRETEPTLPDTSDIVASNLVSTANGTVVGFEEIRGDLCVKPGEDVSEGELLVSGVYGSETSPLRLTRARGKVFALCEREYTLSVPLNFEKKVYTQRQKIKKSLIFFEKEVKFFRNSGNSYTSCDTIIKVEYFDLFGLGKLPFGIKTVTEKEYVTETASRTEAQAAEQANLLLWQSFYSDCPEGELAFKSISGGMENGAYVIRARIQSIENIAAERRIEVDIIK